MIIPALYRAAFALITIILLLCSCSSKNNRTNNNVSFTSVEMQQMEHITRIANVRLLQEFDEKLTDLHYYYRAKIWQPKALQIDSLAKAVYQLLETSKKDLMKKAGISDTTISSDQITVSELFLTEGRASRIFNALVDFRKNVFLVDSNIQKEFNDKLNLTAPLFDTTTSNRDNFASYFFSGLSVSEAALLLDRWQNNLLAVEYKLLLFFREQIPNNWDGFYVYAPIVTQSANIVEPGEPIEITAGVGSYSVRVAKPVITINQKKMEIGAEGYVYYKFFPVKKAGTYFIPVTIEYNDGYDRIVKEEKTLKYTVVK